MMLEKTGSTPCRRIRSVLETASLSEMRYVRKNINTKVREEKQYKK